LRKSFKKAVLAAGAVLLVALTALAARRIDHILTERMAELKSGTISALESIVGRRITYSAISPSIFQYLEVRDVRIYDSKDPDRSLLAIHTIRVSYSLAQLLIHRDPIGALREIRILNTRFSIDLEKDRDLIDLFLRLAGTNTGGEQLHVRVTGANVSVSLASSGTSVSLDNLFFQIEARKEAINVSLRGGCKGELPSGFTFASVFKANGSLDRSLSSSDLTVHLLSLESSLFSTGSQTLQVLWNASTVDIRKIQDRSPVVLELMADLQKREFILKFQSQDMRPDHLFTLSGPLARYANWMKAPLTASGHLTYRMASGSIEYQMDASAYLEDQLPIRQVMLEASFRGSDKEAFFEPLRISSPNGALEFEGSLLFENFFPQGLLTLVNVDSGSGQKVNARLSLERFQGKLNIQGDRLVVGELAFDAFRLSLSPIAAGASFSMRASFAGARLEDLLQVSGELRFGTNIGKAVSEGAGGTLPVPAISLSASLENIPPDKLYLLLLGAGELPSEQEDIYSFLGRFSVSADVSLSTDFSTLSVSSREVTVTEWDDTATVVKFGFAADTSRIAITGFSGFWKGFTVAGSFDGRMAQNGQLGFTTDLKILGTLYSFTGNYSRQRGLLARGSYGLSLSAVPLRGGVLSFKLQGERFPLPLRIRTLPVSFQIAGLIAPDGDWSADFPSIVIYNVPFPGSMANSLELSGKINPRRLDVTRLVFKDEISALEGSAEADIELPAGIFDPDLLHTLSAQGNAVLTTRGGGESYSAKGTLKMGALAAAVRFTGSPLARIGSSAIRGSLSGAGTISGPVEQPIADFGVALNEGRLGTDTLSVKGNVTLAPDSLLVSALTVGYLSHRLSDVAGNVDVKNGTYSFSARYQGEYFTDKVRLVAGLGGQFDAASMGSLFSGILGHGLKGKLALSSIEVADTAFPAWSIGFHTDTGRLAFDGGPGNSIHGEIDSQLSFSFSLANPLPISGAARGRIMRDRISSSVEVTTMNLPVLNQILKSPSVQTSAGPQPVIHFTSGLVTGRLTLDGILGDPDFSGQLEIVGGGMTSAYSPDEAGPIRTTLTFEGKTARTEKILARAGPARLLAQLSLAIDHWAPSGFDISLATEGPAPVRLRALFGQLIAAGSASGQVRIAGDERTTNVTGNLLVTDCRITLGQAPQGKFIPEEVPTFVTLTAETGKRVEFYWPSENVPILRTTAGPGGKLAITYRGDTGAYSVKGLAGVQGGEIYYFDRPFIVKKGSITFNETQESFDPRITARAEVREWDPNTGEEVKIYLDADSALSKLSPRLSSDPARAEAVILALIGAPILTRAGSQGLGMAALVYTDILTQGWILRPFEQKVRQLLNLDMFSVRTQIIQNLVAQKVFGTTVSPLDNTSMSLGKYIGNDLFLELLVRLQSPQLATGAPLSSGSLPYEDIATGATVPPGNQTLFGTGLQPDLELSIEWATPLFLLTWSWVPQHPESMFLSDNSLSFSWRITY
jgi:hypothetical protein